MVQLPNSISMTVHQAFEIALQHHRAGRLAEAETLYRQILQVQPNHADALHFLGVIADQSGQHELAIEWIRRAIALQPNSPAAHSNLGEAYRALGRLNEAIASYRNALALNPESVEAHNNLGLACVRQGRLDEAIAAYRRALELRPEWPDVHLNLGIALRLQGQPEAAEATYQRALQLKPNWPEAFNNLGNALRDQGRLEDAIAKYRRAIELQPNYPEAHSNLAVTLTGNGHVQEAMAACRQALAFRPDCAEAHVNLGNVLTIQGQLDEAIVAYHRALELSPHQPAAHVNLGNALKSQGRLDEAFAAYRSALRIAPDDAGARSNLIYALHFQPRQDDSLIALEHERWNRQFSDPVKPLIQPHGNDRNPERRLRIGYVSPDFRDHVVGRNILPLFRCHDHREFEVLCYSGVMKQDAMTNEFRRHSDRWRSTVGLSDERLAEVIRQDGVDVLIDLAQHTAENRLPMFARQPAPVQVSFAGYPASAGVDAIQYRLSDRWLEEKGKMRDTGHRMQDDPERAVDPASGVLLLDSFWCFDPCGLEVEIGELPARTNGFVTFGSLNNFCKINEPVVRLWAKLLNQAENSRLILLSNLGTHRQQAIEFLENLGVEKQSVEFLTPGPRGAYFELYNQLDVVLDPFPYNGHSTSLDALWMGVPVVTLAGNLGVSRGGLSILHNLGLPELVAHSEDEYVAIATELARDLSRLTELRQTLRPRMEASVLMDAPHFARQIEAAYRSMWRQWCIDRDDP
jgi:predicted O-linked N-acetylglucosamine transferase (SPINDLY family)